RVRVVYIYLSNFFFLEWSDAYSSPPVSVCKCCLRPKLVSWLETESVEGPATPSIHWFKIKKLLYSFTYLLISIVKRSCSFTSFSIFIRIHYSLKGRKITTYLISE
ncbi:hypothetical protein GLOIN_2v1675277, partial [Rhizophagus irregularis DAOM 181602=DAOM 197198]